MRKAFLFCTFCMLFIGEIYSQQLAQTTQFMENKLITNAGYAGSASVPCFSCIHRSQWIGLEGAPVTSILNFHIPLLSNRVGMGVAIQRDQIGPTTNWDVNLMYSYRIPIKSGTLGIGIQGKIKRYLIDVPALRGTSGNDPLLADALRSKILPNFGVGAYYETKNWYLGVSATDLAKNELTLNDNPSSITFGREQIHLYTMAGAVFKVNDKIKFRPAVLAKFTPRSPFDLDVHGSMIFFDKLSTGMTYRMGGFKNSLGESIDLVLQYQFNSRIRAGLSYDYSLGMVNDYTSGTWEVFAQYCFHKKMEGVTNPRYF